MFGLGGGCCCEVGKVLIWNSNCNGNVNASGIDILAGVYTGFGAICHTADSWTGNLSDYKLIIFPQAIGDPTWWATVTGGGWSGRVVITAEHNGSGGFFSDTITYVSGKSATTGITLIGASIDAGCSQTGTAETDDLTAGCANILLSATSEVSGGTVLSKTPTGAVAWVSRNKVGSVDWVVSGDSNQYINACPDAVNLNAQFLENLWTVPI